MNDIIDILIEHNRLTFESLYKTYYKKMFAVSMYYVQNKETAEDILHDAFIVILQNADKLQDKTKLEQWMCGIVRNLSLKYVRDNNKTNMVSLEDTDDIAYTDDETATEDGISYDTLMMMVNSLPENCKLVFKLSVLDGKSHKQIAEILNISPETSAIRLFRARNILKQKIIEYRKTGIVLAVLLLVGIALLFRFDNKGTESSSSVAATDTRYSQEQEKPIEEDTIIYNNRIAETNKQITEFAANDLQKDIAKEITAEDIVNTTEETKQQETILKNTENTAEREILLAVNDYDYKFAAHKKNESNDYEMKLSYSGNFGMGSNNLIFAENYHFDRTIYNETQDDIVEEISHRRPIVLRFSLSKPINKVLNMQLALQYNLLTSKSNIYSYNDAYRIKQNIHYLGLNVGVKENILQYSHFNMYLLQGIAFQLPVYSVNRVDCYQYDEYKETKKENINVHNMWSAFASVGLEYKIHSSVYVFIEPQLSYYFVKDKKIKTYLTDNKLLFDLPIGIRINL